MHKKLLERCRAMLLEGRFDIPKPEHFAIFADLDAAIAQQAEPVAWRHRWKDGNLRDREWAVWSYSNEEPTPNAAQVIEPLYAAGFEATMKEME